MAEDSADRWEYEAKLAKRIGFEQQPGAGTARGCQL